MDKHAKIYVTGNLAMVGSAIARRLQQGAYTNILTRTHAELDLLGQRPALDFLKAEKPGCISWDETKPDGTPRKLLDVSCLVESGWRARVRVTEGVAHAYRDFAGVD